MKLKYHLSALHPMILVILGITALPLLATAQSTAFTYQGRLDNGGTPATGIYDLRFTIYDAAGDGDTVGGSLTNAATAITNGLFTVTLDFGPGIFTGLDRWLEIGVRTNGGGAFSPLIPRQALTPAPYSAYAFNAGNAVTAAYVPAAGIAGFIAPGNIAAGSITGAMLASNAVSQLSAPDGSPANALSVNPNGLIGIGTSTPAAGLQIATGAALTTATVLFQVQNGTGPYTNLNVANYVAASGDLLAVGANNAITLMTITNPAAPNWRARIMDGTGSFTNINQPYGLAWSGANLIVASYGDNAVTIISAANPASPVKLAELRDGVGGWDNLAGAYTVAVAGNLLAIGSFQDSAITLADISNLAAPVFKSTIKNGTYGFTNLTGIFSVAMDNNLLAIGALGSSTVTLVDVTDPTNPQKRAELKQGVGSYANLLSVNFVALNNNLLAIAAGGSHAVTLVDVSQPANPVKLAELINGVDGYALSGVGAVALSGNVLAITAATANCLTVVDVSQPAQPVRLTTVKDGVNGANFLTGAQGVTFIGTNLAVCSYDESAVTLLGLSTPLAGLVSADWVGLGTPQPLAPLHVVGNVIVENAGLLDLNAARIELGLTATASGNYATALGNFATASGDNAMALGFNTSASGEYATALGFNTIASGNYAMALGNGGSASGPSAIALGSGTSASGSSSTALGYGTAAMGFAATALGSYTTASNAYTLAAGRRAQANHVGTFVWADSMNTDFASTATNQFLIRAGGGVGINKTNPATALDVNGTITATHFSGNGAGLTNLNAASLGGTLPLAQIPAVVVTNNATGLTLTGTFTGNGAGVTNVNAATLNGLSGAGFWQVSGNVGTSPTNGFFLGTVDNQPLEIKVRNLRALRIEDNGDGSDSSTVRDGAPNLIGGSPANFVAAGVVGATIGGGGATNWSGAAQPNSIGADYGTIGGGIHNTIQSNANLATLGGGYLNLIQTNAAYATISGGRENSIGTNSTSATIGGGIDNAIWNGAEATTLGGGGGNVIGHNSDFSTIGGGSSNVIQNTSFYSTIAGGSGNTMQIAAWYSAIGGGSGNQISTTTEYATIPGGRDNLAASYAFAAGYNAQATNSGAFVWSDGTGTATRSATTNSVTMRASGGYRFFTGTGAAGAQLAAGGTAWAVMSDRNVKKDFAAVDSLAILEKLAELPLTQWHYQWESADVTPHIGPMAQDFKAAFYPGSDDKTISTLEADGVAFAAIQGLNLKLEARETEIESLKQSVAELKQLVQALGEKKQVTP